MDENRKLFITALVVILGGNASGIFNAVSPNVRHDPFTGRDGAELKSELHEHVNDIYRYVENIRREDEKAMEAIRTRLARCEYINKECGRN
jgi:hypothetical protein